MTADTAARDVDVAELRRLEAAAAPAPWAAEIDWSRPRRFGERDEWITAGSITFVEDIALITAARNALPALLAMAEENADLRRDRDEARESAENWRSTAAHEAEWGNEEKARADALAAQLAEAEKRNAETKTWVVIRDPGCVPQRKGPIAPGELARFLREAFEARPISYVEVVSATGSEIDIQDGPECLQMLDGRSMAAGSRHNARLRAARAAKALIPAANGEKET